MLAVVFILLVFFFPETKWHRVHPKEIVANNTSPPAESKTAVVNLEEASEIDTPPSLADGVLNADSEAKAAAQDPCLGRGTPSKQQFKLFQTSPQPIKALLLAFWTPWRLFAFPIIEYAAFVVSWSASSFLTINLTQAQNFSAPPYNFSSQSVGFTNFALLVGTFIGLLTNGRLSDWIAARATKKNGGIREPEMRLPTLIPYVLIMLLGNFVVAFGYQHKWDWRVCFLFSLDLLEESRSIPLSLNTIDNDKTNPFPPSNPDHRHYRLYLRRDPSCGHPGHRLHLRGRQLQAGRGLHLRRHHGQQERLGLRLQQVHHALEHRRRLRPAHHAQHVSYLPLVQLRGLVLFYWQALPEVESEVLGAQYVDGRQSWVRGHLLG